ncbi:DUF6480 family protein [Streptomyces sp. NBRC 109706]|uniref:DUF6480 family protein n=1 Tax=Streptomyces sp. NBRC 109706 TaxID=1550035 RepID=UPI000785B66A|nr:DUF6480 family protein [Streptomyces sp. NBRC 109706]
MTAPNPDPDPDHTPGYRPGAPGRVGETPPGETPPAESGTTFTGPDEEPTPSRGWAAVPLTAVSVVTALFVAFFIVYAVWIWID